MAILSSRVQDDGLFAVKQASLVLVGAVYPGLVCLQHVLYGTRLLVWVLAKPSFQCNEIIVGHAKLGERIRVHGTSTAQRENEAPTIAILADGADTRSQHNEATFRRAEFCFPGMLNPIRHWPRCCARAQVSESCYVLAKKSLEIAASDRLLAGDNSAGFFE